MRTVAGRFIVVLLLAVLTTSLVLIAIAYLNRGSSVPGVQVGLNVLGLQAIAGVGLWIVEVYRWSNRKRQSRANSYQRKLAGYLLAVANCTSYRDLVEIRTGLLALLPEASLDLEQNRLSQAGYDSFYATWQNAVQVVRDRDAAFKAASVEAAKLNAPETRMTNLARFLTPRRRVEASTSK